MERHGDQLAEKNARCRNHDNNLATAERRATMGLNFPNQSRAYDATRRAVRFWGHDSAMEASFFVTEDALKQLRPGMQLDEPWALGTFDANRELIYAAATKVYARGRRGSYDVVGADF